MKFLADVKVPEKARDPQKLCNLWISKVQNTQIGCFLDIQLCGIVNVDIRN